MVILFMIVSLKSHDKKISVSSSIMELVLVVGKKNRDSVGLCACASCSCMVVYLLMVEKIYLKWR